MTILALLLSASTIAAGDAALARVDGVVITADAVARRSAAIRNQGQRLTAEQVLDSLVDEALLAAEGRRLGLAGKPDVAERIEIETRRAAAEAFVDAQVAKAAPTSEAELRDMFHRTADFAYFESATFATADQARAAVALLRSGKPFADATAAAAVQHAYPDPRSAPAVMRSQIDGALAPALFAASRGDVVGPIQVQVGFAVARVIGTEIGSEQDFAARRAGLAAYARKQSAAMARQQFAVHLRETAHVEIDKKFLEGLGAGPPTAAQLDHVIAPLKDHPVRYRDIYATIQMLGGAASHIAGPSVKLSLALKELENRLIENVAVERGFDKAPEVVALRPEFERTALAFAAAGRISAAAPPGRGDAAIVERLGALRKTAKISVDRTALANVSVKS